MKFVDRIDEQRRLHDALHGDHPSALVVVYGRRRIGKSTLIKKVLRDDDVYFMADNSESVQQRRLLAKALSYHLAGFDKVEYPDWESLFQQLNYRTTGHFTLCIDEFPFLVKVDSTLPSVLQKLIDTKALKYSILLCGSSQQMMQGLVLDTLWPRRHHHSADTHQDSVLAGNPAERRRGHHRGICRMGRCSPLLGASRTRTFADGGGALSYP